MIIKYDDIILRAIEEEDMELLREMLNDPVIEHMTIGTNIPVSKRDQSNWFANWHNSNEIRLIIETEEHGSIGSVGLTEIDWMNKTGLFYSKLATSKNIRGKGYGTKATNALIKFAFEELNLHCIYSIIIDYNIASQRVKEKCGFTKDGILRSYTYKNGQYHDAILYSIVNNKCEE